ncbi:YdcH family protein [Pseudomonas sp. SMV71]|uniref:YdcH family protein n=1 Tax=unclassified Pseudomonas TaxID=196821 RepID=UPI003F844396
MPVTHDLCQDLKCTKDHIQQKRSEDPRLDSLLQKYSQLDAEVVDAEKPSSAGLPDDALETLKKKRLLVKDKIVMQLQK